MPKLPVVLSVLILLLDNDNDMALNNVVISLTLKGGSAVIPLVVFVGTTIGLLFSSRITFPSDALKKPTSISC